MAALLPGAKSGFARSPAQGFDKQPEGGGSVAAVGVATLIAGQGRQAVGHHRLKSFGVDMRLNLIQRQISQPQPGQRGIKDQVDGVEDRRAVHHHPRFLTVLQHAPTAQLGAAGQAQIKGAMLDQMLRFDGDRTAVEVTGAGIKPPWPRFLHVHAGENGGGPREEEGTAAVTLRPQGGGGASRVLVKMRWQLREEEELPPLFTTSRPREEEGADRMPLGRIGPEFRPALRRKGRRGDPREEEGTAALLHGTSEGGGRRNPCWSGPFSPVMRGNIREEVLPPAPGPREEEWPRRIP